MKWYRKAAEQGEACAQYLVGGMCDFGRGVPKDDKEAAKWYRLAADQGHAFAQLNLGLMYLLAKVFPKTTYLLTCGRTLQGQTVMTLRRIERSSRARCPKMKLQKPKNLPGSTSKITLTFIDP